MLLSLFSRRKAIQKGFEGRKQQKTLFMLGYLVLNSYNDGEVPHSSPPKGNKMEAARKAKREGKQGICESHVPWPAAMPVGECLFKNPGVGQALHIVSVLAAASSVLLAASRKAGVVDWPAGCTPETESTGEKEVAESKCGCSGIRGWDAIWEGPGMVAQAVPYIHSSQLPRVGRGGQGLQPVELSVWLVSRGAYPRELGKACMEAPSFCEVSADGNKECLWSVCEVVL